MCFFNIQVFIKDYIDLLLEYTGLKGNLWRANGCCRNGHWAEIITSERVCDSLGQNGVLTEPH